MSYASGDSRPVIGKAAPPAAPIYDTTIWASDFGGERRQRADGLVLPTDDWAYGGAMGVDRTVNSNLRLGAFVGAGREAVELNVQTIDSTYVFGGGYGRFDWATQYLDSRSMAATSTIRVRVRSPTTRWRTDWKSPPPAMAAGSSAPK
jgi:outer membrane autotransporter protein